MFGFRVTQVKKMVDLLNYCPATDQNKAPSGIWPPPKAPQGAASVSKLPSNIKFERSEGEGDQDSSARTASQQVPHTGEGREAEGHAIQRQMSRTGAGRDTEGHALQRQTSNRGDNSNLPPRQSEGQGQQHGDGSVRVYRQGDGLAHPHASNKDHTPQDGPAQVLSRRDSAGEGMLTGEKRRCSRFLLLFSTLTIRQNPLINHYLSRNCTLVWLGCQVQ